jgi:hypothetical protein
MMIPSAFSGSILPIDLDIYGAPRPYGRGTYYCSAESAEAFLEPAYGRSVRRIHPRAYARGLLRRRINSEMTAAAL